MAIQHKDIPDADLHENKGAAGATAGHVLIANGDGTSSFADPLTLSNIEYVSVVSNYKSTDINPSSTDTPLQASFDGTTSSADITMDSGGTITIENDGLYQFEFNLNFGRSTATGTAITLARFLINDVAYGFTQGVTQNTINTNRPLRVNLTLSLSSGDTLKVQIMRDSAGQNDGGLIAIPVTDAGWDDVPSFFVRGSRIRGGI